MGTAFAERSPATPRRNWLSRLGRGLRALAEPNPKAMRVGGVSLVQHDSFLGAMLISRGKREGGPFSGGEAVLAKSLIFLTLVCHGGSMWVFEAVRFVSLSGSWMSAKQLRRGYGVLGGNGREHTEQALVSAFTEELTE